MGEGGLGGKGGDNGSGKFIGLPGLSPGGHCPATHGHPSPEEEDNNEAMGEGGSGGKGRDNGSGKFIGLSGPSPGGHRLATWGHSSPGEEDKDEAMGEGGSGGQGRDNGSGRAERTYLYLVPPSYQKFPQSLNCSVLLKIALITFSMPSSLLIPQQGRL